jgi:hypothetical protein
MHVHPTRDRSQIVPVANLETSPRAVVPLGTAPDGLPWLLRVDRSSELSTLFTVVPQVFGLSRREDLPKRVRDALEKDVAAGLMGVHDIELDGEAARGFVARKKLKRLLGPTLLAQLLEGAGPPPLPHSYEGSSVNTNVGAMASRDQDDDVLDAVDRTLDALRSKRHLLIDLKTGGAYSCSVREEDRALRVPSAPMRPLSFEALSAFADVDVVLASNAGSWIVPLADRDAYAAALLRIHQSPQGGWVRYDIRRQRILAQLVEVARGVDELHRTGRVHADLAPGNVLVCADGGRAFDGLNIEAGSPATAATFEWAAPEQIVGHPVDPRTDVFALGRIATAVLGGVVFGEQTEYVVPIGRERSRQVKLLKGEGVFIDITESSYDRAWQRAWQELLGRSISFSRERRPATAGAFADELADALERYPVASRMELKPAFGDILAVETSSGPEFAHLATD